MKIRTNPFFPQTISELANALGVYWRELSEFVTNLLPDQTGNSGKYLTTDGTDASWASLPTGNNTIIIDDEGTTLASDITELNFVGSGVTATNPSSGVAVITIPGASGGGGVSSPGCADNYAIGTDSLRDVTTGCYNFAAGTGAGASITDKRYNIAIGNESLTSNSSGEGNIAIGVSALRDDTNSYDNVAIGYQALMLSDGASVNTAIGGQALTNNNAGSENTAIGFYSLSSNHDGTSNTALGYYAGYGCCYNGNNNTYIGAHSGAGTTNGDGNTFIGAYTSYSGIPTNATNYIVLTSGGTNRAIFDGSSWIFKGNKINIVTAKTPSSSSDTGNAGDICWDVNYLYVCVAYSTWTRIGLSSW
jgi:hypothetical protein